MTDATIIYPHQLFRDHPAVGAGRPVYLVEEPLLFTHNPIHRQRLLLHVLSMNAYERELAGRGLSVTRLRIGEQPTTEKVFERLRSEGVARIHVADTTDTLLERALGACGFERVWYESPQFLLGRDEAVGRYEESGRSMGAFYRRLRKDRGVLVASDGSPTGGKWSYDEENRKKIPRGTVLPDDIAFFANAETTAAAEYVESVDAELYGAGGCWIPYTPAGAERFLDAFLEERFHNFGPYEDAMSRSGVRLWHSTLSPLLNTGLLTPGDVLARALEYADAHAVPLNSLEGFVRQILGWREFIRAAYECDGSRMRTRNFFEHHGRLSEAHWSGTTGIAPFDHITHRARAYGYTHHIERLMVAGNLFLLSGIDPDEVYRWFMGMYVDAFDWVMVPNVYGMSQFADGGMFATKPYISGAAYLKKLSDFPGGEWESVWTGLYWRFIHTHRTLFEKSHRMSMMPRMLDRMTDEKRNEHFARAETFLETVGDATVGDATVGDIRDN